MSPYANVHLLYYCFNYNDFLPHIKLLHLKKKHLENIKE